MSYRRTLPVIFVIFTLMLATTPIFAEGAGPFYCSTTKPSGGTGTAIDPWACTTPDQFDQARLATCKAGSDTLYFIFSEGYIRYTISDKCEATQSQTVMGAPPTTGVSLPMPLVLATATGLALIFITTGAMLRFYRRRVTVQNRS